MLEAEFERRFPDRYRSLHRTIHDHVIAGIRATRGLDRQLLAQQLASCTGTARSPPVYRGCAPRARPGSPGPAGRHRRVLSLITRGEGVTSAELAERWLAERPEGT